MRLTGAVIYGITSGHTNQHVLKGIFPAKYVKFAIFFSTNEALQPCREIPAGLWGVYLHLSCEKLICHLLYLNPVLSQAIYRPALPISFPVTLRDAPVFLYPRKAEVLPA